MTPFCFVVGVVGGTKQDKTTVLGRTICMLRVFCVGDDDSATQRLVMTR